uniref:Complexin-1 n=1 Tax=Canis lupus familiaris TaxID=9615 RepID=A0A8C0RXM7_CANLF
MEFVMKQALGGATKDMGKMLGGDEEKDPDAAKKEEERQEALRQEEEERKAKYAKMEAEREAMRQGIRDKVGTGLGTGWGGGHAGPWGRGRAGLPPPTFCRLHGTDLGIGPSRALGGGRGSCPLVGSPGPQDRPWSAASTPRVPERLSPAPPQVLGGGPPAGRRPGPWRVSHHGQGRAPGHPWGSPGPGAGEGGLPCLVPWCPSPYDPGSWSEGGDLRGPGPAGRAVCRRGMESSTHLGDEPGPPRLGGAPGVAAGLRGTQGLGFGGGADGRPRHPALLPGCLWGPAETSPGFARCAGPPAVPGQAVAGAGNGDGSGGRTRTAGAGRGVVHGVGGPGPVSEAHVSLSVCLRPATQLPQVVTPMCPHPRACKQVTVLGQVSAPLGCDGAACCPGSACPGPRPAGGTLLALRVHARFTPGSAPGLW